MRGHNRSCNGTSFMLPINYLTGTVCCGTLYSTLPCILDDVPLHIRGCTRFIHHGMPPDLQTACTFLTGKYQEWWAGGLQDHKNFNPLDFRGHPEGTMNPTAVNSEVAEGRKIWIRAFFFFVVVRIVICNPRMREIYTISYGWVRTWGFSPFGMCHYVAHVLFPNVLKASNTSVLGNINTVT